MNELYIIYTITYVISLYVVYTSKYGESNTDTIVSNMNNYYDNYINVNIVTQILFEPIVKSIKFLFPILDNVLDVIRSYIEIYESSYVLHIEILLVFIFLVFKITFINIFLKSLAKLNILNTQNFLNIFMLLVSFVLIFFTIYVVSKKMDSYNKKSRKDRKTHVAVKQKPIYIMLLIQVLSIISYIFYSYLYFTYGNVSSSEQENGLTNFMNKYLSNDMINIQFIINIIYVHFMISTILCLVYLYLYEIDKSRKRKDNPIIVKKDIIISLFIYMIFMILTTYKNSTTRIVE
jgi:hypothetical protein